MKQFLFSIPAVLLLASCASKPDQRIVLITPETSSQVLKSEETTSLRHPEIIRAYPVGRYVEPRRRGVMHEAHTIYRVESSSKWNLNHPARATTLSTPVTPSSKPTENELTVELNRQRQATQAVIQGSRIVSDKLTEMTTALQQNRTLAEQNAIMRKELHDTRQRLEMLEEEMRSRVPVAPQGEPEIDDLPW